MITIKLEYLHHTEQAVLVSDGSIECWLPIKFTDFDPDYEFEKKKVISIQFDEWLALRRNKQMIQNMNLKIWVIFILLVQHLNFLRL